MIDVKKNEMQNMERSTPSWTVRRILRFDKEDYFHIYFIYKRNRKHIFPVFTYS